jgi:hypothetical protein
MLVHAGLFLGAIGMLALTLECQEVAATFFGLAAVAFGFAGQ